MINLNDVVIKLYQVLSSGVPEPVHKYKRPMDRDGKVSSNPCYTINVLSLPSNPDSKLVRGTAIINAFADNFSNNAPRSVKLSEMITLAGGIFDDKVLSGNGFQIYDMYIIGQTAPLLDHQFPNEHYQSLRLKINLQEV